jgi:hypothetical protein
MIPFLIKIAIFQPPSFSAYFDLPFCKNNGVFSFDILGMIQMSFDSSLEHG